jgi:hypothetical protein
MPFTPPGYRLKSLHKAYAVLAAIFWLKSSHMPLIKPGSLKTRKIDQNLPRTALSGTRSRPRTREVFYDL